jgi:hypothetical protein
MFGVEGILGGMGWGDKLGLENAPVRLVASLTLCSVCVERAGRPFGRLRAGSRDSRRGAGATASRYVLCYGLGAAGSGTACATTLSVVAAFALARN